MTTTGSAAGTTRAVRRRTRSRGSASATTRAPSFTFEPLREEHLALVERWMLLPHVREWWDDTPGAPYPDLADHRAALRGDDPTSDFLIVADGRPIGLIEAYVIGDHPEYARQLGLDEPALGVDIFIGERDMLHRGHGPRILREFLRDVAFPRYGVELCVIGPAAANAAAIRAYEKAGFEHWKDVVVEGERWPEHLMTLRRTALGPQRHESPSGMMRRDRGR